MMMMTLMQCIKQARWPEDGPLSILPGVEVALEKKRISEENRNPSPMNLVELTTMSRGDLDNLMSLVQVPDASRAAVNNLISIKTSPLLTSIQFLRVVTALPQIGIDVTKATAEVVEASISRKNPSINRDFRIQAPKFPKPQTEGYFIILGDTQKDEIYALKRVGFSARNGGNGYDSRKPVQKFTLNLPPPGLEGVDVSLIVISDGYIGLDSRLGVRLQTTQAVPGTWIEKDHHHLQGHVE